MNISTSLSIVHAAQTSQICSIISTFLLYNIYFLCQFNVSILYYEDKVWVDDQTFSVSERSSSCAPSSPSGARRTRPAAGAFCLGTCSTLTGENINVDSSLDLVNIIGPAKVSWWHKWQMLTPGTAAAQTSCQVPAGDGQSSAACCLPEIFPNITKPELPGIGLTWIFATG